MKKISRNKLLLTTLFILALAASAAAPLASGRGLLSLETGATTAQETVKGYVVARIYYENKFELDYFTNQLDVWETHNDQSYVVARISPDDYLRLTQGGYRVEIDEEKTNRLAPEAVLDPRFYYFDNFVVNPNGLYIVDFLQNTAADFSNLAELFDAGDAWQASHGGHARDIWVLRITNEDPAYGAIADKPAFFLFASIHAREVATPELAIRYIKYLTSGYNGEGGYGIDPDVTWLVNHNVAYVLVMQNPDGRAVNEANTSAYIRKNMNNTSCATGNFGIDLNRNHSFFWGCCGGSSGYSCDWTYRGVSADSEPETDAFQTFFATVIDDQNGPNGNNTYPPAALANTHDIFISLHSYSDLVMAPWDLPQPNPNAAQLSTIQRKLASMNGYVPGGIGYTVDGPTDDWTYGIFGIASFTFEVGPGSGSCGDFFPAYGCLDGIDGMPRNFWAENKPTFLYAHKIARTPYMTSYGPDTETVAVSPLVVTPGELAQLTATVADHRYSGDPLKPVAAAEYFVDTPGADGAGSAMAPADGNWGSTTEGVVATLDTTGLPTGAHYILVHGRSNTGDWGPFTAVWLYVLEPGVAPVIDGYVRDATTNQPVAATVTAGAFEANSDPATGYYSMTVVSGTYPMQAVATGYLPASASDVVAADYQTVQQNFYLNPDTTCTIYTDNVENGVQGWIAQAPWAITTESSHSATHSWTESPGGNYANNRDISLTSQTFDLSSYYNVSLSFWHINALESGYDFGYVEYSTNGGSTWSTATSYTGNSGWRQSTVSLSGLDGAANAKIRFHFTTDTSQVYDGWHIDDITLSGGGANCQPPIAPSAEFASSSPAVAGTPVAFTDQTYGSQPLNYAWDFGDGLGSSTLSDPRYTFNDAGVYTVTLNVTNTAGSDSAAHTVLVEALVCQDISGISLSQLTPGNPQPGVEATFSANVAPDWATKPYSYTLDFGDGVTTTLALANSDPFTFAHTYAITGVFPLEISAWNCAMPQPVTDTLQVEVAIPVCNDLTGITLTLQTTSTLYAGSEAAFLADFAPNSADTPYQFTLDFGDGLTTTSSTSQDPFEFFHVFNAAGSFPVEISAWNCEMTTPVTDGVLVPVDDSETFGFELTTPITEIIGLAGYTVTYSLELTNTSSTTETFTITFAGVWSSTVSSPAGSFLSGENFDLAAGETLPLTVTVAIPVTAADGESDGLGLVVDGLHTSAQSVTLTTVAAIFRQYLPLIFK